MCFKLTNVCIIDIGGAVRQTDQMTDLAFYKAFGSAVATRRKAIDLTQAELASRVGMSRASIANIERGRQSVLLHHVYQIASALELSRITELLPPLTRASLGEELKMKLSYLGMSHHSLSKAQESQVLDFISSVLPAPRSKSES